VTAVLARATERRPGSDRPALDQVRAVRRGLRRRTVVVSLVLAAVLALAFCVALTLGDFPIRLGDVVPALFGEGRPATRFIVGELRLPRAGLAVLVGICLGMSGAIFQSMLRNPLASPDIIGITSGASASAVVAILMLGYSGLAVSAFAFGGSVLTAAAMYGLAWRRGVSGYRMVLVGIGCAAVLSSVVDFLLTRTEVYEAQTALRWLTGSLNGAARGELVTLALLLVVLVPVTLGASRALAALQLGDDAATAVGARVERSRLLLILLAVALASVAVAAAGPIGFVAFVAGPIARRMTRGTGIALVPAGLVGALVVLLSDVVGQHLLPVQLPVGVLTAVVGAPYLLYLLVVSNRVGSGG
jgi:iron complex transport system permease protein